MTPALGTRCAIRLGLRSPTRRWLSCWRPMMAMWTARSKRSTRRPGQLPSDRASAESRTHLAQRISTSCMYTVMSHGRLGQEEPTCTLSGSSAHRRMMARSDSDLTRTHPRANLIPHMRGLPASSVPGCQLPGPCTLLAAQAPTGIGVQLYDERTCTLPMVPCLQHLEYDERSSQCVSIG